MTGNWQNRIIHFETPPPNEVWEKIAEALDEEFKAGDIMLSQKMNEYEIAPPAFILDNVLAEINPAQATQQPAKIIALPRKRIAIAAVTIGVLALATLYFLNPESSSKTKTSTADILPVVPGAGSTTPSTEKKNDTNAPVTHPGTEANTSSQGSGRKPVQSAGVFSRNTSGVKNALVNRVLPATEISPISVTAPPIYDNNGNIIMDVNLVSAPDENYIIVTSPNGEQTKISRKFLKMLCMMNGGIDYNYMNAENYHWKMRFEEWRSKLLQQASYIPTANNFLDIVDLKELLQEN